MLPCALHVSDLIYTWQIHTRPIFLSIYCPFKIIILVHIQSIWVLKTQLGYSTYFLEDNALSFMHNSIHEVNMLTSSLIDILSPYIIREIFYNHPFYIQGDRNFLEQTLTWGWDRWNKHFLLNCSLVENAWWQSYKDFKFEMYWRKISY